MDTSFIDLFQRLSESINKFIIPILMGPNFIKNGIFFVETKEYNILTVIVFAILTILAFVGYIKNYKKFIANLCAIQLLSGVALHIILGFGLNTGIIYASLYVWAFLILISLGMDWLFRKNSKTIIIAVVLIILIVCQNVMWIYKMSENIKNIEFEEPQNIEPQRNFFLKYSDGTSEQIVKVGYNLLLVSTGEKILKDLDGEPIYYEKENYITGNIEEKGAWYKIYIEDDKLKINICENIKEINTKSFYIFGMGTRGKFILKNNEEKNKYQLINYSNKNVEIDNLEIKNIDYENYIVTAKNNEGQDIKIYENNKGIYYERNNEIRTLDETTMINIPDFDGYKHRKQLKTLFNEVMINISNNGEGITPNFMTYPKTWYRDAAIGAMVLNKTNNINQIENWIKSINTIYDHQNGEDEPDNLGELLYLISLCDIKNEKLINDIINEAKRITSKEGYLEGKTDGSKHPVYQTAWLIFGLKNLGLDYSEWKIPDVKDTYQSLIWFDEINKPIKEQKIPDNFYKYQYLEYASYHYYKNKGDFLQNKKYPISFEFNGSKANFHNIKILGDNFKNNYITTPHLWSASEMFLYYLDLDEGKL